MDGGDGMTINNNVLTADAGKVLIKGDATATVVYLGINDSASNWTEQPQTENEEATAEQMEAALQRIGGAVDENQ